MTGLMTRMLDKMRRERGVLSGSHSYNTPYRIIGFEVKMDDTVFLNVLSSNCIS